MLSLDIVRKALVLPQSNVLDLVDTPGEGLFSLRSDSWVGQGVGEGKVEGAGRGRSENWIWNVK